jgi:ABC-2 type transport system ATP-binding protein
MRAAAAPDLSEISGEGPAEIRSVDPTFEDAFISRLRAEPGEGAGESPPMPSVSGAVGDGPVIAVNEANRFFGDFQAVKAVSFEVRRGEVFGLLGANGAGKTTTFRMLCGLLPASGGHLEVAGHDLRRAAAKARARIGYMAQRFSLYVNLTVEQNLRFFASAYGLRGVRFRDRIRWALDGFDLRGYADMASGDLPLGYKQRLAMAAALMHEPDILFLDEPTSGVDPLARREFWHRINLLAEHGVTVLVTTHFMDEANYCDRLLIMADGETLAQGTPAEMKARFRGPELVDPTMEDAFIGLLEERARSTAAAA